MGNIPSISRVDYEEVQNNIRENGKSIMIHVLSPSEQDCLIYTTIRAEHEEDTINQLIKTNKKQKIIIYGKNCNDERILKKFKQLISYGFDGVSVYTGGMFEWLCLQDIYGEELFHTNGQELDLLKYK